MYFSPHAIVRISNVSTKGRRWVRNTLRLHGMVLLICLMVLPRR